MTHENNLSEQQQLQNIADEYIQQGYAVIIKPSVDQIPDFLGDFQPDLIAKNGEEGIVVEIRTQASLTQAPELDKLALILSTESNWRLDLIVINPNGYQRIQNRIKYLLNRADIDYRIREARDLSQQEHGEAAFLLIWSSLEALLRRKAEAEVVPIEQEDPSHLIKSLYTYGQLSPEQYHFLQTGIQARNSIIHGYKDTQSLAKITTDLLMLIDQLMEHSPTV